MSIYINIVSGTQKGAATLIQSDKKYAIGSNLNSDVVLLDSSIEEQHVEVSLRDDKLILSNCQGSLSVNDKSVDITNEFECPLEAKVTVGTIDIFIGADLKNYLSINRKNSDKMSVESSQEADTKPVKNVFSTFHKFIYLSAGTLAITAAVLTLFGSANFHSVGEERNLSSDLKVQLRPFKIKNLSIENKRLKRVEVSGISIDNKDHKQIMRLLDGYGVRVSNKIVSSASIKSSVDLLLDSLNLSQGVKASFTSQGDLVFVGTVSTKDEWKMFVDVMAQDIQYITEFNDENVITINELIENIKTDVGSFPYPSELSIVRVGEEIMIRGELEPTYLSSLENNVEKVRASVGIYPNIITQIAEATDPLKGMSISLVSITDTPYIVIDDGKKYREGDRLDNGYLVREIKLKYVTFEKYGKSLAITI